MMWNDGVMPTGRIKFFSELRDYGFIQPDDGAPDIFIHGNRLLDPELLPITGDKVEYLESRDKRDRREATRVRLLEAAKT